MNPVKQVLRAVDGVSLAAVRTYCSQGTARAREVLGATLAAATPSTVPAIDYWDLVRAFPVRDNLVLYGGSWADGCTAPLERFLMAQLLRYFQPGLIVEVGTYRGSTTKLLLDNCRRDARIFTIDLLPGTEAGEVQAASDDRLIRHRVIGEEYLLSENKAQVEQVLGNTFDEATWSQIPEGVEFAFVDASHSYEAVRNDTERLWPRLSPNAVVLWHDYTENVTAERGVGKYLRELMRTQRDLFICPGTDLGFRIPAQILAANLKHVGDWFPAGDYRRRYPGGPAPWLT